MVDVFAELADAAHNAGGTARPPRTLAELPG
jgi:hypothetical protein